MHILDPCPFVLDFPWFHFLFHQIKDTFTFSPKSLPLQFHDNLRQSQTHPSSHEKPIRKPNSDFLIQIFKWKMIAEVDPPPVNKVLFSLHTIYYLCHQKGNSYIPSCYNHYIHKNQCPILPPSTTPWSCSHT